MKIPSRRSTVVLLVVIGLAAVFGPAAVRTYEIARTADGLVVLASLSTDELSFNPWSVDAYLLSPSAAVWLLERYDWPYRNRQSTSSPFTVAGKPLLHSALSLRGLVGSSPEQNSRLLRLIEVFVDRGCPVEVRFDGYTALHLAILFADVEAAGFLIDHGADIRASIDKSDSAFDTMNGFEFAEYLNSKDRRSYADIHQYVESLKAGA